MNSDFITELEESLGLILTEQRGVAARKVNDAINNKYRVQIRYNDSLHRRKKGQKRYKRKKSATGFRLIEPFTLGVTRAGNRVLRAFQYNGATKRGTPKWKLFRLDRIIEWVPLPNSHFYVDPSYNNNLSNARYNTEGDRGMVKVINQVKFNNEKLSKFEKSDEWEAPADRVNRELGITKQNIQKQRERVLPPDSESEDTYEPKELDKTLANQRKNSFNNALDKILGIGDDKYERDSMSAQQRRDAEVNRRRDKRWQQAVDNRRLWRKDSMNNDLYNSFRDDGDYDSKFGEDYYDDTYDEFYEPDNYNKKIKI